MDTKDIAKNEFDQQVSNVEKPDGIIELLAMPEAADVEFEPPRPGDRLLRLPERP